MREREQLSLFLTETTLLVNALLRWVQQWTFALKKKCIAAYGKYDIAVSINLQDLLVIVGCGNFFKNMDECVCVWE